MMITRTLPLLLLLFVAVSCSGAGPAGNESPDLLSSGLPAIPELREASAPFVTSLDGSAFIDSTGPPRVTTLNEVAILQSNAFINAWAIWQFPQAGDPILEISTQLRIDPDNFGYIGLADYETGRWSFIPAEDGSQTITIDQARNLSALDNIHVAIIALHGDKVLADGFGVTTDKSGWHVLPVVTDGDVGRQCDIAEVDGKPAIVSRRFVSGGDDELVYAYSLDELGLYPEDWSSIVIDTGSSFGSPDLEPVNGNPAIAYEKAGDIRYVRSSTAKGHGPANWGVKVDVDTTANADSGVSLATADSRPAIAYRAGLPDEELRYAVSSTLEGTSSADWDFRGIESGGDTGYFPSMQIVDGNPAIAYYDMGNEQLSYIRSTDARGDGPIDWIQFADVAIQGPGSNYFHPVGLLVSGGTPGLAYLDSSRDELYWVNCSTSLTGAMDADWDQSQLIVEDITLNWYGGAALVDGNPAVCYKDDTDERIHYSRSSTASGIGIDAGWDSSVVFEADDGSSMLDIRMSTVAGRPVICLYRSAGGDTHDDLYYAVLLD